MNKNTALPTLTALALVAALAVPMPAWSQVAGGTTTVDVSINETTRLALGWSVKKTLLGKTVYNDAGAKVGKVEDLIISPDKNLSYVIVGAGGFIGIGRHDVAVPVTQIQEKAGRLVMAGATKDSLKALPGFVYANDNAKRAQFLADAEKDVAKGKQKLAELEKKSSTAVADAKTKLDAQVVSLQAELKSAEAKLGEMKQAASARWKEFESGVSAATARLRKAIDTATA